MTAEPGREGLRMYDELIAVHAIMRRGSALSSAAFARLARSEPVDVKVLTGLARWFIDFVHHHHASEDELFWPVLRKLFPDAVADLDQLTAQHVALDAELHALAAAVDSLAAADVESERAPVTIAGRAAAWGAPSADTVHDILLRHLDAEEPVLAGLFPQVPDGEIVSLRRAIIDGAPRSGPYYVFGLLEDPDRPAGYRALVGDFPRPVRWLRPVLLGQYRSRKSALGV
jgi:hemerythrin-like domain-containing protein